MKVTIQMIAILTWCFYTKYVYVTVKYPDIVQRYNQFIDGTDLYVTRDDYGQSYTRLPINLKNSTKEYTFSILSCVVISWTKEIRDMNTSGFH